MTFKYSFLSIDYVKTNNTWSVEVCGEMIDMIMPIPGGLQACKEKCNGLEECTAFEYALTTWDDDTDCCILRNCPLPVPKPEVTQAKWHDGSFDYVGYAKRKILISIIRIRDIKS